jgi:hypothetical protein
VYVCCLFVTDPVRFFLVAEYRVIDFWEKHGAGHLRVAIDNFPAWAVEAVVMQADTGPCIADLRVYPLQPLESDPNGTWFRYGSRVYTGSERPAPGQKWSEVPSDIPGAGVPATLLRSLNTGKLIQLAQREATAEDARLTEASRRFQHQPDFSQYLERRAQSNRRFRGRPKRPGRAGNGIDHYLMWAVWYDAKVAAGVRHVNKELAKEHGRTPQYVRDTTTDARRRYGLLTKPGQGRAGGRLTEKALRLLEERQQAMTGRSSHD